MVGEIQGCDGVPGDKIWLTKYYNVNQWYPNSVIDGTHGVILSIMAHKKKRVFKPLVNFRTKRVLFSHEAHEL